MPSDDPVRSTGFASIAVAIIFACSAFLFSSHPMPALAASSACLLLSDALLFMAMRKFANRERRVGSEIVKRANVLGFAGIGFMLWAMTEIAGYGAYPVIMVFAIIVLVWSFGKKRFRYW